MLNFYESPEKIIGLLKIISEYDINQRGKFNLTTQEQVVSALIIILLFLLSNICVAKLNVL